MKNDFNDDFPEWINPVLFVTSFFTGVVIAILLTLLTK